MKSVAYQAHVPEHAIDVVFSGHARKGYLEFNLNDKLVFSTTALESYAFARWEPVIFDAMVVAAAIEYADRSFRRPMLGWSRAFKLRVPVLEPSRWADRTVMDSLQDAASFLTGDGWSFEFVQRFGESPRPLQDNLELTTPTDAVLPFSDGLDSLAVAGIMTEVMGNRLVRVRVGSKASGRPARGEPIPFAAVPYGVKASGETSARSRGFKFAMISGIAAYLTDATEIIVSESAQGIFGAALVTSSAQAYPDFRSHPFFTSRMKRFLEALLKQEFRFVFPRMWSTKGETLDAYVAISRADDWRNTHSCWQSARHCSLGGRLLQCGTCAACMLRRMSVHAARLADDDSGYAACNLRAETFDESLRLGFQVRGDSLRQYAIAGAQHLDHMVDLVRPENEAVIRRHAILLNPILEQSATEVESALREALGRHAAEWRSFLQDKGTGSFLTQWTSA